MFDNPPDENEKELERIFEEKLYVGKKHPLADVSNVQMKGINKGDFHNTGFIKEFEDRKIFGGKPRDATLANGNVSDAVATYDVIDKENIADISHGGYILTDIPKETALEGIYEDLELRDVLRTKAMLMNNEAKSIDCSATEPEKKVSFDAHVDVVDIGKDAKEGQQQFISKKETHNDIKADNELNAAISVDKTDNNLRMADNSIITDKSNKLDKIHRLEREFQNMIQTHKDTLKAKSKVYKFIYNEIYTLRSELTSKIDSLERENTNLKESIRNLEKEKESLKDEVASLKDKIENFKEHFRVYNIKVTEKAMLWKSMVESKVKEYLKKTCK